MVQKDDEFNNDDINLVEEIVADEAEMEDASEQNKGLQKIKKLRQKLALAEEEKKKLHEELQRNRADFLNSRRRLEEQGKLDKERAADKVLLQLLLLADSFDLAKSDTETWNTIDPKGREGVEAIYSQLNSILSQYNLIAFDPVGEPFDPEQHEAVSNVHVENEAEIDTVISVIQKGYKRGQTIIRPARVIVGTT